MTLTKKNQGFTIVELLIVIVVIGILAAIVLNTFSGVQRRARNTNRETDITAIHSQLEVYFADNGQYPLLSNVNDPAWRNGTGGTPGKMPGLDAEALNDPGADPTPATLVAAPAALDYAYAPTAADGTTACDNTATICEAYVLTATYEGGGTYTKTDLN